MGGKRLFPDALGGEVCLDVCSAYADADRQDPVTSRARQREQAGALVRGHGVIVADFFDSGQSRTVAAHRTATGWPGIVWRGSPGR